MFIMNIGVWHSFRKNETATMFFFLKLFSSFRCYQYKIKLCMKGLNDNNQ